jgi:hypothetical protein
MPSASLILWSNTRLPSLAEIDAQCAAIVAAAIPSPSLIDENLRAYVLLLSAHFQGFCRDLYTECSQFISDNVRVGIQFLIQQFFTNKIALDHGNPNLDNMNTDFSRFGFSLDLKGRDPANEVHISHLGHLNKWRNAAAHHGNPPKGIPLNIASIRTWKTSCSGLATSLDGILYNQLRTLIHSPRPWTP